MQGTVVKIEVRMGSGRVEYERLAEKKKKNIHSYNLVGKRKTDEKNAQTRCMTKLLYSQTRGMHTSSA